MCIRDSQWNDYVLTDNVIDSVAPRIVIYSPGTYHYGTGHETLDLNFTWEENNGGMCWYEYNGTNTTINCNTNITFNALQNQQSTLTLYSNDSFGHLNSTSVTFIVDTVSPTISSINPKSITVLFVDINQTHYFRANVEDSLAGVDDVWLEFDGNNYTATLESGTTYVVNLTGLDVGTYNFKWYANDTINASSGNLATSDEYIYSITATSGGGGGGASIICGDGVCTYPENSISCPQDCANMSFTLDISSYKLPGFPGGLISCIGEAGTCSVTIKNDKNYEIEVKVKIQQTVDDISHEWAYILVGDEKVKETTVKVPANGFARVKFRIEIPEDVDFGEYRFDAIFETRDQKTVFPFIISVEPIYGAQASLSVFLNTITRTLTAGFVIPRLNIKIQVWMIMIIASILITFIYLIKKSI